MTGVEGIIESAVTTIREASTQQTDGKWLENITVLTAPLIREWDVEHCYLTDSGPSLLPLRIEKTRGEWHPTPGVEFYVDFEFCSDLNDNFPNCRRRAGSRSSL